MVSTNLDTSVIRIVRTIQKCIQAFELEKCSWQVLSVLYVLYNKNEESERFRDLILPAGVMRMVTLCIRKCERETHMMNVDR